MTSSEEDAAKLLQELQSGQGVESVLQRIQESIFWTPALAQSVTGKALFSAIRSAPSTLAQREARAAYHAQLREAKIAEPMERWWAYPPVPTTDDVVQLPFIDATDGDERWEPESVSCSLSELFAHPAQRFRVAANKKYRHPFLPSRHFDILMDKNQRVTIDSLDSRIVADVVKDQREVRYVRNDHDRAQREEQEKSPSKQLAPWDRARIFPSWCVTPDSWFDPAPPPGFAALRVPGEQYYIKVPTLHIPGAGILPTTVKPQLIARNLYLPVRDLANSGQTTPVPLDQEQDYVPLSNRLVPSALTTDNARSLLGRYIQSSTEPMRDNAPPSNKKRKTATSNKFDAQTVAVAWGLTLDDERKPDWLHCVQLLNNWQYDVVLDLKGLNRQYGRTGIAQRNCAWVGAMVLDADLRAPVKAAAGTQEGKESYETWAEKAERWIRNLNKEGADKLVEVGENGTFLAGDVELAKGDNGEFELSIAGGKPGVWRMSVTAPSVVTFTWVREGAVDYDVLPPLTDAPSSSSNDAAAEWEELGTFSVDSGRPGLFSQSVFDSLASGGDRQAKIETFLDARLEGLGDPYVPGGVILTGDDGEYKVEGIRDSDGKIIHIRMHETA